MLCMLCMLDVNKVLLPHVPTGNLTQIPERPAVCLNCLWP